MKKIILIFSIMIGLFLFSTKAYADSPITSTDFSKAYDDISLVEAASKTGVMNLKIATYLANPKNPIDIKAAIINALSWDIDGKNNTELYCKYIYKKSIKNIKVEKLRGDQQFCIGYLMAMDDFSDTQTALRYLKLAEKKLPTSFTISVVRALVESMDMEDNLWDDFKSLLVDRSIQIDMRQDAINIILDYMALYDNSKTINISRNNMLIQNETSAKVYLYGTNTFVDMPYQITKNSDIASIAIKKDQYGIFYLDITGLINGTSSIIITTSEKQKVTIDFDVVSKEIYDRLSNSLCLFVGSTKTISNLSKINLTKKEIPFMKKNNPYIPLKYSVGAMGGEITYNKTKKIYTVSYNGKTITLKLGSKYATKDGKTLKLTFTPEVKNGTTFISVKDFQTLTGKKYLFYNGLLVFMPKNTKLDSFTDDAVLDELSLIYVEELKDGYFDGRGVYTWSDGTQYSGQFSEGELKGFGIYSTPDGEVREDFFD